MRFPHNHKVFRGQLDAAPFVGVLFLIVIFLLINSSIIFTPGVPITLPEGETLPGTDKPTAVVAVDEGGQYYFENQLCDETRLKERLQAAVARSPEPLALVVLADEEARAKSFVRLVVLARSIGIREVVQAVRPSVIPVPALIPTKP